MAPRMTGANGVYHVELSGRGNHRRLLTTLAHPIRPILNPPASPVRSSDLLGGKHGHGHLAKQAMNCLEQSFIEPVSDGMQK